MGQSDKDKIELLTENKWFQYHSKTRWVHPDITVLYWKAGINYYGKDYLKHQLTLDEAYELCLYHQI